ncbi:MAG: LacI family DNA-binding transcriptional regulator [Sphingomicrobium sp.]
MLNNLGSVGEVTRERILEVAERLRYVPHEGARSLTRQQTSAIGLILPDLHGEFFSELLRGADAAARAVGFHLLVSTTHGNVEEAASAIRSMRGRVDGLLLMSPHIDSHFTERHLSGDLPVVFLNTQPTAGANVVSIDDYAGAVTMVRHLAGLGRSRIAHIAGPVGNSDAAERVRGYRGACPAPVEARFFFRGDFTVEAGRAAGRAFAALDRRPDAIFAANDLMAAGCMEALAECGIAVPAEVAVGGFDDVPLARFLSPPLTTMRTDVARFGRRAIEHLVTTMENSAVPPKADQIVPLLVIRQSCGYVPFNQNKNRSGS